MSFTQIAQVIKCYGYNIEHRDTKCYCYSLGLLVPVGKYPKPRFGILGGEALALDLVFVALDVECLNAQLYTSGQTTAMSVSCQAPLRLLVKQGCSEV